MSTQILPPLPHTAERNGKREHQVIIDFTIFADSDEAFDMAKEVRDFLTRRFNDGAEISGWGTNVTCR